MTNSLKSWDEYAADQREAQHRDLTAIRKLLQWVIILLLVIAMGIILPLIYVLAQQ